MKDMHLAATAPSLTIRGNEISVEDQLRLARKLAALEEPGPYASAEEVRSYKRKRRAIKNRESAHRSRIRKRMKVDSMETKMERAHRENRAMKAEMAALKRRVAQLESHNARLESQLAVASGAGAAGRDVTAAVAASTAVSTPPPPSPSSSPRSHSPVAAALCSPPLPLPLAHAGPTGEYRAALDFGEGDAVGLAVGEVHKGGSVGEGSGACISANMQRRSPHTPSPTDASLNDLANWKLGGIDLGALAGDSWLNGGDCMDGGDSSSSSSSAGSDAGCGDMALDFGDYFGFDDGSFPSSVDGLLGGETL